MPQRKYRYPKVGIRSKNELSKRISGKNFPPKEALNLINDVLKNHDKYWHDLEIASEPDKNKYVRNAKGTPLGKLLSLINRKVLAPHDSLIPHFIFGGVSNKDHVKAAYYLLGKQRKRTKLSLDISKFFEQNKRERVFYFFNKKCECSVRASNILADLCCVPIGPKNDSKGKQKVLARGFATSTRLAIWCNLDLFLRIYWKANKVLKNKDTKIAIFVDDIGISATKTKKETMDLLAQDIEKIFKSFDTNQALPLNIEKKDIKSYLDGNMEHLGLRLGRNKLSMGKKTITRINELKQRLKNPKLTYSEKKKLILQKKSYIPYRNYIRKINKDK